MPGPLGIIKNAAADQCRELQKAAEQLQHAASYKAEIDFSDDDICAGVVYRVIQNEKFFLQHEKHFCWFEGEIYNLSQLQKLFGFKSFSFAGMLLESYSAQLLDKFLSKADGCFSAVLYDSEKRGIHLLSDRLGMTPLYFMMQAGTFAWAPEIKAFTAFSSFKKEISQEALDCFMDLGHMLGDITWFKDVNMLDAATILTFDIGSGKISKRRYWKWGDIRQQAVPFGEAAIRLGELLQKSVSKRFDPSVTTGLSLSGGLDSRAVLASLVDPSQVYVYTFGIPGSQETEIAKKVCSVMKLPHHELQLDEKNWLGGRANGVWRTDGMYNLKHMHATPFYGDLGRQMQVNMNGFIGDPGNFGSWVSHWDKRISAESAEKKFSRHYPLTDPASDFFDIPHEQPFYIDSRVRRFTNAGVVEGSYLVVQRRPFIDNELMEFSFSLPGSYRKDNRLYRKSLLHFYPELFRDIPKAFSSHKVGAGKLGILMSRISEKIRGQKKKIPSTNYAGWLREKSTVGMFSDLLDPQNALYPDLVKKNFKTGYLLPHLEGRADLSEQVGRAATLELWLQQVYNKKFLHGFER
jgi:asparagine synthase (glutamine-hydrolysing)